MLLSDERETLETITDYREAIVGIASELIGSLSMKYTHGRPELGKSTETGFDCSGFVTFVLSEAGVHIPQYIGQDDIRRPIRHANEYWDYYGVAIHEDLRRKGDLIFFSRRGDFPTHIGIVRDEESYIHAPGSDFTRVSVAPIVPEPITFKPRLGLRQLYVVNPIGYKAPTVLKPGADYRSHQVVL